MNGANPIEAQYSHWNKSEIASSNQEEESWKYGEELPTAADAPLSIIGRIEVIHIPHVRIVSSLEFWAPVGITLLDPPTLGGDVLSERSLWLIIRKFLDRRRMLNLIVVFFSSWKGS